MIEANNTWVRNTINKGWTDNLMPGYSISTIGRWYDENHQPYPIHIDQEETEEHFILSAELAGVEAQNIAIDIVHGCLIILVRENNFSSRDEHYQEIQLPKQVNHRFAEVEFSEGLLTVVFGKHRKNEMVARLRSVVNLLSERLPAPQKLSTEEK